MRRGARIGGKEVRFASTEDADVREVEPGVYSILHAACSYEAQVVKGEAGFSVRLGGRVFEVEIYDPRDGASGAGAKLGEGRQIVKAPMPGKVVRTLVAVGDAVEAGQGIAVVEAMKMQNEMKALKAGRVVELRVAAGDTVGAGSVLAVVE